MSDQIAEQPDQDDQKVPAYSWYALSVLVLVYVLNFVDRQILSILANDIKADLGVDDAYLGFLYGTAFAIFYALFGIPLGRLADSWKRVRLMTLGLTLWSAMTAFSGFARDAATLFAAGFRLHRLQPIDQFLFSAEIELIADRIFRKCAGYVRVGQKL